MKIIAVSRILNEEDIVEPLIRHHAPLVDHHIVLDNGSVDRTVPILQALRAEGARLTVLRNDAVFFSETQYNTFLYELAVADFGADWVVFLDGDEFIDLRGEYDLAGFLAGRPAEDACVGLDTMNYEAPTRATAGELNVVRRLVRHMPATIDVWKVCVRGGFEPGRVEVDAGQHHISLDGVYMPPPRQQAVRLAHYPTRGPLHWGAKAVTGRLKVLAAGQSEVARHRNAHYLGAVEALKTDAQAWARDATQRFAQLMVAPDLVDDPLLYLGEPLTHTRVVEYGWRALGLMLANMEKLARAHGALLDDHPLARAQADAAIATLHVVAGPAELATRLARRAPPRAPAMAVQLRRYQCVSLAELAAGLTPPGQPAAVEAVAWWPANSFDVPPVAFGEADLTRPNLVFLPEGDPGAMRLHHAAIPFYYLHGAIVRGDTGIVTIGNRLVAETEGPRRNGAPAHAEMLTLPDRATLANLQSAYHLLSGNLADYSDWLFQCVARFHPPIYDAFSERIQSVAAPQLLLPPLNLFWKWESLRLHLARTLPRLPLAAEAQVFVQRLLYVPDLSNCAFNPHPAQMGVFDIMRAAVTNSGWPPPWRRLYILSDDSGDRKPANNAEIAARAEAAGFTVVAAGQMAVHEQVRLFAEASHIIAPHGESLANIAFCQPSAVVCELHPPHCVNWKFRRLAALRGARYGCMIGMPIEGGRPGGSWRLDLTAFNMVLKDPQFFDG